MCLQPLELQGLEKKDAFCLLGKKLFPPWRYENRLRARSLQASHLLALEMEQLFRAAVVSV